MLRLNSEVGVYSPGPFAEDFLDFYLYTVALVFDPDVELYLSLPTLVLIFFYELVIGPEVYLPLILDPPCS